MKNFKDLNITATTPAFTGDKIKIERLLNREIQVMDFKIEKSKYEKGNGKCLTLQVQINNQKHVVFTGSIALMEVIEQVDKKDLPFSTTIIKENDRFQFS
jgi:hypothetical protein